MILFFFCGRKKKDKTKNRRGKHLGQAMMRGRGREGARTGWRGKAYDSFYINNIFTGISTNITNIKFLSHINNFLYLREYNSKNEM